MDKNYKEILTADYTMVNNVLNKIYRSNVSGLPPYKLEIFESWDKLNTNTSLYQIKSSKDNRRIFNSDSNLTKHFRETLPDGT